VASMSRFFYQYLRNDEDMDVVKKVMF